MNGNLSSVRTMENWKDDPFRKAITEDSTHA